jgi:hypothetical protein
MQHIVRRQFQRSRREVQKGNISHPIWCDWLRHCNSPILWLMNKSLPGSSPMPGSPTEREGNRALDRIFSAS